jgi:FixJ family two-component response regulator
MNMAGPKVAIVDDDENVRRALRRMVVSLSYLVEEFASGETFLDALKVRTFAFVLLDLHMPELNGIDVLTIMRGEGNSVPVIVITGGDEPRMRERCLKAGASVYLLKPIARDEVLGAIHSLAGFPKQTGR